MMVSRVKRFPAPSRPRKMTAVSAIATMPLQNAPPKKNAPKSVLFHCGASDMIRSKATSDITAA